MMGGEFCGNASMATAVWLSAREDLADGAEREMLLEVSGAGAPVRCRAARKGSGWTGSAEMPLPREIRQVEIAGRRADAVFFAGMVHLIAGEMPDAAAEELLDAAKDAFSEPAIGLLQWSPEDGRMKPLVWVRESGTQVWETACGSGTAAIAAWKCAAERRDLRMEIAQPGGTLLAETVWREDALRMIRLSGSVGIGKTETVRV